MGHFDRIRPVLGLSPFGPFGRCLWSNRPGWSTGPDHDPSHTRSSPSCEAMTVATGAAVAPAAPPRPLPVAPVAAVGTGRRTARRCVSSSPSIQLSSLPRRLPTPSPSARVVARRAPPRHATAPPCLRAPGRLPVPRHRLAVATGSPVGLLMLAHHRQMVVYAGTGMSYPPAPFSPSSLILNSL